MKSFLPAFFIFLSVAVSAQKESSVSFKKWLSLKQVNNPVISPNGRYVLYSVTSTDWSSNSYDPELWLSKDGETPFQLTRTAKGGSTMSQFTPDSRYVSFVADRGEKPQLYIIGVDGGEALQVTREEEGINTYDWRPDGQQVAFTKPDAESKTEKTTREKFGAFAVEGEEFKLNHLWVLPFNYDTIVAAGQMPCALAVADSARNDSSKSRSVTDCVQLPKATRVTEGPFTVGGFSWRPDGKTIAFNSQPDPLINSSVRSDIVLADVATRRLDTVIANPTGDFFLYWSPDGKSFVYSSSLTDSTTYFYKNNRLFVYNTASRQSKELAGEIDENKSVIDWTKNGIYFLVREKTKDKLFLADPATGRVKEQAIGIDIVGNASFGKNTDLVAISGRSYAGLSEIFTWSPGKAVKQLTANSEQIKGWNTPINEVIEWKSKDGATIEGILLKPRNFDATKKYPLLVVIHGGPTGTDLPDPAPSYVYPMMQWVEKGAIVLRVNYRGSAGYGEKFRALNVRNLGIGDMWDVMSGIGYLDAKGWIDTSRMGAMGWSQGGYISAFLTTNTNVFKAISVGAGISNWVTYYVNTDITPFTRQYLQATPWSDMPIYQATSPMTNINKASTPTLIQHGEFDRRVPIPNAYELYRGLQDRGVPSKLVVYKGFGHGISKPKERLAAVWHNWLWFNHYVFGDKEESIPVE